MKRNNKKGFTIVELVIVIAVIGILAAVLIPTFSSVIDQANASADLQKARNEYTEYLANPDNVKNGVPTIDYVKVGDKYFDVNNEYELVDADDVFACDSVLEDGDLTEGSACVDAKNAEGANTPDGKCDVCGGNVAN